MKVINMTPHAVHIVSPEGVRIREYPASGGTIRLKSETVPDGMLSDGTPVTKTVFGEPIGLPDEAPDTVYLVSQLVKNACPARKDLLVPAEVVRDADGNIVGCKSLGR